MKESEEQDAIKVTIIAVNVVISLIYNMMFTFNVSTGGSLPYYGGRQDLDALLYTITTLPLHVGIALVIAAICQWIGKIDLAKAWLLAALIILILGFSICSINITLAK